ncbi:MAG: hypothetical protein Satyrvirus8_27 [Satyrvirus sp.]|uniref:Uncharacterized protein n=1 Tax=Satyrvirus sp. TaxID=2487771 RepID=A0A3G5AIM8_9VIRU|nr:MAG: hypothetical protein Satyrvirus8_27 [Satyrvirus sp.]
MEMHAHPHMRSTHEFIYKMQLLKGRYSYKRPALVEINIE